MKFRLHGEWRQAWKWFNTQLGALITITPEIYNAFDEVQDAFPQSWFQHTLAVLGVLVIINAVRKKQ